jgi:hypothetical protein
VGIVGIRRVGLESAGVCRRTSEPKTNAFILASRCGEFDRTSAAPLGRARHASRLDLEEPASDARPDPFDRGPPSLARSNRSDDRGGCGEPDRDRRRGARQARTRGGRGGTAPASGRDPLASPEASRAASRRAGRRTPVVARRPAALATPRAGRTGRDHRDLELSAAAARHPVGAGDRRREPGRGEAFRAIAAFAAAPARTGGRRRTARRHACLGRGVAGGGADPARDRTLRSRRLHRFDPCGARDRGRRRAIAHADDARAVRARLGVRARRRRCLARRAGAVAGGRDECGPDLHGHGEFSSRGPRCLRSLRRSRRSPPRRGRGA